MSVCGSNAISLKPWAINIRSCFHFFVRFFFNLRRTKKEITNQQQTLMRFTCSQINRKGVCNYQIKQAVTNDNAREIYVRYNCIMRL